MTEHRCRALTPDEMDDQHRLYMLVTGPLPSEPTDVGQLLYCPIHRRPLIECHDERNSL